MRITWENREHDLTRYRVKFHPYRRDLPIETAVYTFHKLWKFLGNKFNIHDWADDVGTKYNRSRAIILYSLRECWECPADNALDQLIQTCRKYKTRQPLSWPRFLREKYPVARIKDFFSVPYEDVRDEFYEYEAMATDAGLNPEETGKVFDVQTAMKKFVGELRNLIKKMDVKNAS